MKRPRLMLFMFALLSIGMFASVSVVYAPWQTLGTGYAIDTDYHGIDVFPGTPVTATAGTLDHNIVNVTFRWHMPNGTARWEVTKAVEPNGTLGEWNNGTSTLILYANDTQILDVPGDWGVQAFFQGPNGIDRANLTDVVKIRAQSFKAVPEVPLGTIITVASMLAALGVFTLKKKRIKLYS